MFWGNYLNNIHKTGVKPSLDQWLVKRAEEYIAILPLRFADHGLGEVDAYLREAGRKPALEGWQFRWIVDAIQSLFEQVGVGWIGEVDWDHWRDSVRTLEKSHPT